MSKKYLLLLFVFWSLFSCTNTNNEEINSKNIPINPEMLYIDAMSNFETKEYDLALEKFEKLEKIFPLSNEAVQSQIMSAFIDYIRLNYDESIYKFNKILIKYPSHKNLDYVYYMKAICYYEKISHQELDGSNNINALENFERILNRFPDSKYAKDSQQKIILVKSNIAAKHMSIGSFYQENEKYIAALNRFKIVVNDFSVTKFTPEALHRMVEIYYKLGMKEEAINTAAVIGYNYPESEWYKHSYHLLGEKEKKMKLLDKVKNLF
ncbi:uncharacterized protein METZ01_LOCUS203461 [marine metagenome]|uniref:Outer membrane lipoprotein BamD-like domain-containing protein n=1 Tax=marine metagenome TaxID=408172 RepID=A0A382EL36_9ZZZZ